MCVFLSLQKLGFLFYFYMEGKFYESLIYDYDDTIYSFPLSFFGEKSLGNPLFRFPLWSSGIGKYAFLFLLSFKISSF